MGQSTGTFPRRCARLMIGMAFIQPDMVNIERIKEPDFALQIGYSIILLEFRVQESPKTHMYTPFFETRSQSRKYLRVSEVLVIDTMTHLKSNIPIQCRVPPSRSQLLNRESMSPSKDLAQLFPAQQNDTSAQPSNTASVKPGGVSRTSLSPHVVRSPVVPPPGSSPNCAPSQFQNSLQTGQVIPPPNRPTSIFGFNPATPEHLIPLSMLQAKKHGDHIDCLGVIENIYRLKRVDSIGREKRDLDILDPSQPRRTVLSGKPI